jgi:hypothetical protein
MTERTELLEALVNLFRLCERTARMLEEEAPDLAEVGYWTGAEKAAFERARRIVERAQDPERRDKV